MTEIEFRVRRLRRIVLFLCILSFALIVALLVAYDSSPAPYRPSDLPFIEHARGELGPRGREWTNRLYPIVIHLHDRTCVELRKRSGALDPSITVCYDTKSGRRMEEVVRIGF